MYTREFFKGIRNGNVKGKEKLVISRWERKQGTSKMDIESCKSSVKKKEVFRKHFLCGHD